MHSDQVMLIDGQICPLQGFLQLLTQCLTYNVFKGFPKPPCSVFAGPTVFDVYCQLKSAQPGDHPPSHTGLVYFVLGGGGIFFFFGSFCFVLTRLCRLCLPFSCISGSSLYFFDFQIVLLPWSSSEPPSLLQVLAQMASILENILFSC